MKIKNPTDNDIEVQIFGTVYKLEANGELSGLEKRVTDYWTTRLHGCLIVEEEDAEKLEKVEIVAEAIKEDEEVEEVEVDLTELKRPQLNEIAEQEGLDPKDYKNSEELIEALMNKE